MDEHQHRDSPIWPYIGVVACLMILSLLSSRTWRTPSPEEFFTDSRPIPVVDPPPVPTPSEQLGLHLTPAPAVRKESPAPARVVRDAVARDAVARDAVARDAVSPSLEAMQAGPQVAAVAPPVAEHIQLDRSVAETPPLPRPGTRAADRTGTDPAPARRRILRPEPPAASSYVAHWDDAWPYPATLAAQLRALRPVEQQWADAAMALVDQICGHARPTASKRELIDRLLTLARQVRDLAEQAASDVERAELLRGGYAIERRARVWQALQQSKERAGETVTVSLRDGGLAPVLAAVERHIDQQGINPSWREYLRLSAIAELEARPQSDRAARQQLACQVMRRFASPRLNAAQAEMLEAEPFSTLRYELRHWCQVPLTVPEVLASLERYEDQTDPRQAIDVARHYQMLRWSLDADRQGVAETLNEHYRNANVRLAIHADLLNRLIPATADQEEAVRETILGADVRGASRSSSRLRVELTPDPHAWRMLVVADGRAHSETSASRGPAVFFKRGEAQFSVAQQLVIDRSGFRLGPADARADGSTELTRYQTDYDTLPLVGWWARRVAIRQHDEQVGRAEREAHCRVAQRAEHRMDEATSSKVDDLAADFRKQVLVPFRRLQLSPVAVDMNTTEDRLIARYRLAGHQQLGSHTPRPQAPANSWFSVQLHETALNNTFEQLQLAKESTSLHDLYRSLADTFERPDIEVPEDIRDDVTIRFANEAPVRLRLDDGVASLTLRIVELKDRRRSWNHFAVRVFYVPASQQRDANLVREGIVQLAGPRLRLGDQIALRGIFSKVFSKSRPIRLINRALRENPDLNDLKVTQFVIEDGWLGVALGPAADEAMEHLAREQPAAVSR